MKRLRNFLELLERGAQNLWQPPPPTKRVCLTNEHSNTYQAKTDSSFQCGPSVYTNTALLNYIAATHVSAMLRLKGASALFSGRTRMIDFETKRLQHD
jgi:hypothetical protein